MANQITINFIPCTPTPSNGYIVFYREAGSLDLYTEAGPFFTSPAIITDTVYADGTTYEGIVFSDCGDEFGPGVPFTSEPGGSASVSVSAPESEACVSYTNNQVSAIVDVSWFDCDGTVHTNEAIDPAESICIQPGTLAGENIGLLTEDGPCGEFVEFAFTPLEEDYSRPFAGSFRWNENSGAQIVSGVPDPLNYYRRFTPMDLGNTASGVYDWTKFDDKVKAAINAGQTFSFGFMTLYPDPDLGGFNEINEDYTGFDDNTGSSNTGHSALPSWVLDDIQKWVGPSGDWAPYYNDAAYIAYIAELHGDVKDHINATSYVAEGGPHIGETVEFADVIEFVEIRPCGSYGEVHHGNFLNPGQTIDSDFPAGAMGTTASLNQIIDNHVSTITDWPLVVIFNIFDHMMLDHTRIPTAVGAHVLEVENDWGPVGYRNDHFADWYPSEPGYYDNQYQQFHPTLSAQIMSRYLQAPVVGEPPGGPVNGECGSPFCEGPDEAEFYHYAMVGNGNYGGSPGANAAMQEAFKVMGHIIRPTGGSANLNDVQLNISIDWENFGTAPSYDKSFVTTFELRSGASVVWTDTSAFNVFLFVGAETVNDTFARPVLAPGDYDLWITFPDNRGGYRAPFPLGIEGRTDGAYLLGTITFT